MQKDLCLVYGNCQAEPLRILLAASPAFDSAFRTVSIPPIHLITPRELETVRGELLPQTSLLIYQRVKPGYRGLPLGSEEAAELTPNDCGKVSVPDLYYRDYSPSRSASRSISGSSRQ